MRGDTPVVELFADAIATVHRKFSDDLMFRFKRTLVDRRRVIIIQIHSSIC